MSQKKQLKSNFPAFFLKDFGLGIFKTSNTNYSWQFSEKALQRFHLPITYMETDGEEDHIHYGMKQQIHDYIYENYYLGAVSEEDSCKFYVTTELKQIKNPFKALLGETNEDRVLYKLDVCAIRVKDCQVFDIEIDGAEHTSHIRDNKDKMRDRLLNFRYGVLRLRLDKYEKNINFKKLDEFLNQPAMPYTGVRVVGGKKIQPKIDTIY